MAINLYIAATAKDVGKSTVSFALINHFLNKNRKIGFMKPVGQRWHSSPWGEVEEDVILMKKVFKLDEIADDMNPVVIKRGYTEKYLLEEEKPDLTSKILASYKNISKNKDFVIIEGTGHAGVGSVIDKSNADVASLLDAKVILLAKGGIGSTIDRLELNYNFFKNKGADVIGIIINKVIEKKYDKIKRTIGAYCKSRNLKLFGVIPYSPILSNPTLGQIIDELKPEIIYETDERKVVIDDFLVVASTLEEFVSFFEKQRGNQLLIMPSTRMDITFAVPSLKSVLKMNDKRIFTILFSGIEPPSYNIVKALSGENINILWQKGDTFSIVSKLSKISIKTRSEDVYKIDEIKKLVIKHIDHHEICKTLTGIEYID